MNENQQKQEVRRNAIPGRQGNEVERCILQHMYSYMFRKINKIENTFRKLETTKKNQNQIDIPEIKIIANYIRNLLESL